MISSKDAELVRKNLTKAYENGISENWLQMFLSCIVEGVDIIRSVEHANILFENIILDPEVLIKNIDNDFNITEENNLYIIKHIRGERKHNVLMFHRWLQNMAWSYGNDNKLLDIFQLIPSDRISNHLIKLTTSYYNIDHESASYLTGGVLVDENYNILNKGAYG